jgi:hypothetical protein
MPCYRCGARQVDPDRGESPWRRGVRADRQVLICPGCQSSFDWMAELDRCPVCASAHLVRRLGEVECRDCGFVSEPTDATASAGSSAGSERPPGATGGAAREFAAVDPGSIVSGRTGAGISPGVPDHDGPAPGLAEEVERALARVLGRAGRTARIG